MEAISGALFELVDGYDAIEANVQREVPKERILTLENPREIPKVFFGIRTYGEIEVARIKRERQIANKQILEYIIHNHNKEMALLKKFEMNQIENERETKKSFERIQRMTGALHLKVEEIGGEIKIIEDKFDYMEAELTRAEKLLVKVKQGLDEIKGHIKAMSDKMQAWLSRLSWWNLIALNLGPGLTAALIIIGLLVVL